MRKASTGMPEQGTQAPSPAPDLIPAKTEKSTENLHRDWNSERGHISCSLNVILRRREITLYLRVLESAMPINTSSREVYDS